YLRPDGEPARPGAADGPALGPDIGGQFGNVQPGQPRHAHRAGGKPEDNMRQTAKAAFRPGHAMMPEIMVDIGIHHPPARADLTAPCGSGSIRACHSVGSRPFSNSSAEPFGSDVSTDSGEPLRLWMRPVRRSTSETAQQPSASPRIAVFRAVPFMSASPLR